VSPGISTPTLLIALIIGPLLAFGVGSLLGLLSLRVNNANTIQSPLVHHHLRHWIWRKLCADRTSKAGHEFND